MQTVDCDYNIKVPPEVAVCPICGAEVTVEITEWSRQDDGTWAAGEYGGLCSCITEPEIDNDGWEDWFSHHFEMPYVDWLPVDKRVYRWLLKNYRFNV